MIMQRSLVTLIALALAFFSMAANAASAIQPFGPDSLAHIVESQKGKPYVLIVWSLDCEYCQASLNTLAQEKRKRKGLNVITISTDALDDPQLAALMRQRLTALGMTSNAWAFGSLPPEQLRYAIDPKWHGEMPRSYWFNARGEKTAYSGVITPATIDKLSSR
jgi:thiol-disulfide isomerase/thioredoxin